MIRIVPMPHRRRCLLTQEQPYRNHNGGMLAFGPDGMLYVALGDGGSAGDPQGRGQRLDTLLGKLLRLDVSEPGVYRLPADNPFVGDSNARAEIWAYGLRNPWRFSFDRATGDLYIADVGQNSFEEIDFAPASSPGGENYGWRVMEGLSCFEPGRDCNSPRFTPPIAVYGRDGGCSVTRRLRVPRLGPPGARWRLCVRGLLQRQRLDPQARCGWRMADDVAGRS